MQRRQLIASGASVLAMSAAAIAVPSALGSVAIQVHVRVEGGTKTLLADREAAVGVKRFMRGGHSCSATSAAAAFNLATKGKGSGAWSSSLSDFEVTKILGDTENYTTTKS